MQRVLTQTSGLQFVPDLLLRIATRFHPPTTTDKMGRSELAGTIDVQRPDRAVHGVAFNAVLPPLEPFGGVAAPLCRSFHR